MALGAYTTAILVADHGMRDIWTIPLAGLSPRPRARRSACLRCASRARTSLATFGIAVNPDRDQEVRRADRPGRRHQPLRGRGITGLPEFLVTLPGQGALVQRLALLPDVDDRTRAAGRRLGSITAASDARCARSATTSRARPPTSGWRRTRRSRSRSRRSTPVSPARCSRSRRSRCSRARSRSSARSRLVGLAVGGLGSLVPLAAGAAFLVFLPQWAQDISSAGRPGRDLRRRC